MTDTNISEDILTATVLATAQGLAELKAHVESQDKLKAQLLLVVSKLMVRMQGNVRGLQAEGERKREHVRHLAEAKAKAEAKVQKSEWNEYLVRYENDDGSWGPWIDTQTEAGANIVRNEIFALIAVFDASDDEQ
jgi:hypothetical protein